MRITHALRAATALVVTALGVLTFAPAASAHVTVNPNSATQGGYTKVSFRVPNERDDAGTVKLEVNLPIDQPIASVSLRPVAGWTAETTRSKLPTPIKNHDEEITEAVTKITWTADPGVSIKPGQFQEFDVSLGPLPQVDQIVFKTLQTYSGGEVVRWIEEPANGVTPEHPAPVLKLAKAAPTASAAAPAPAAATATTDDDGDDDGNGLAIGLGAAGLVLGAAALVVALLARGKAVRRTS